MNKCIFIGRLTKDPDIRYSQGAEPMCIARYSLAVDRIKKDGKPSADFINCVAFGKRGEFAEKYLHKGMKIAVEARVQTGSYEKDGRKVYTTDFVVDSQEFCEKKGESTEKEDDGFMNIPEGMDENLPWN